MFILDFSLELEQEDTDSINKLLYTLNHKCEYYHKLDTVSPYHYSIVPVIMDTSHQAPSRLDLQLPHCAISVITKSCEFEPCSW